RRRLRGPFVRACGHVRVRTGVAQSTGERCTPYRNRRLARAPDETLTRGEAFRAGPAASASHPRPNALGPHHCRREGKTKPLERWVSNYRKVGERRLAEDERRMLETRRRGMRRAAGPLWLTWAISIPAFFALCLLFQDPPGWLIVYLLVALAWLAYVPLRIRDAS